MRNWAIPAVIWGMGALALGSSVAAGAYLSAGDEPGEPAAASAGASTEAVAPEGIEATSHAHDAAAETAQAVDEAMPPEPDPAADPPHAHDAVPDAATSEAPGMSAHDETTTAAAAPGDTHVDDDAMASPDAGMTHRDGKNGLLRHGQPQPTSEELACLADLTEQARQATLRLADFDAAVAEGYIHNPGNPDPNATHYPNPAYNRDGVTFDLANPESAIYRTVPDGSKLLVGVLYHAPRGQGPTPCGNATYWHTHEKCVDPATNAESMPGADGTCPAGSRMAGGRIEMMHLWFVGKRAGKAV